MQGESRHSLETASSAKYNNIVCVFVSVHVRVQLATTHIHRFSTVPKPLVVLRPWFVPSSGIAGTAE